MDMITTAPISCSKVRLARRFTSRMAVTLLADLTELGQRVVLAKGGVLVRRRRLDHTLWTTRL